MEGGEEGADRGGEGGLVVEDVAAWQGEEGRVGAAFGHLRELVGASDAAFASADEERGAGGGEPVAPVIAAEVGLGDEHIGGVEGEMPAGG